MRCVTYLVEVYVDPDMSWLVKEIFMGIWILTSTLIKKDHIKDVAPDRAYCKEVKLYKVPSQLYPRHGTDRSCATQLLYISKIKSEKRVQLLKLNY